MNKPRRGESGPRLRLPLPDVLDKLLGGEHPQDGDNLGLWLDKLVRVEKGDHWGLRAEARVTELERLFCPHDHLDEPRPWRSGAAAAALERMQAACEGVYGVAHRAVTVEVQGRLLVDYGRPSALETSLSLHPVLGCPRIPGSALKGLLRAWLREQHRHEPTELRVLLGAPDAGVDGPDVAQQRGRLVLHDALPERGQFQLAVDVLTPHAGEYYLGDQPPADWLSPVPFTFLTVVKTRFRVIVGLLPERGTYWRGAVPSTRDQERLDHAVEVLCEALEVEGIGAKRAAGYGRLRRVA